MSKDIRSFFNVISSKKSTSRCPSSPITSNKKSTVKSFVIEDDDDNKADNRSRAGRRQKVHVISSSSSDSEQDVINVPTAKRRKAAGAAAAASDDKLKPVNLNDVFKRTPIHQSPVPKPTAKTSSPHKINKLQEKKKHEEAIVVASGGELSVHDDKAFGQTLLDLDDDLILSHVDELNRTMDEAMLSPSVHRLPETNRESVSAAVNTTDSTPKKTKKKRSRGDDSLNDEDRHTVTTPSLKKQKVDDVDDSNVVDTSITSLSEEAYEKKRYSAMLYQKYLNRSGPKHHGEKPMPKGKPDCLKNLCFIRTGVLDSLNGDEFENLIKGHGGRTVQSVSKKVNYIVFGDEPGPSKMEKAKDYNIPAITEDELLDMILVKSGLEPKYVVIEINNDEKKKDSIKIDDKKIQDSIKGDDQKTKDLLKINDKSIKDSVIKDGDKNTKNLIKNDDKMIKDSINGDVKKIIKQSFKVADKEFIQNDLNQKVKESKLTQIKAKTAAAPQIKLVHDPLNVSLIEKYKPKDLKGIIGQHDDTSNMNKLRKWLMNWHENRSKSKKLVKPSPWSRNDDGAYFKCALLSGPPGVGKTTTATLVANSLDLDIVEFNASDTRSKKMLHDEVAQLLNNTTIAGFASGRSKAQTNTKRVLIMDEVDGMAGNEDRGGIQELINLIKMTSIPIICMCNDRAHQKMRTLVNYCFDLKYTKPNPQHILGPMLSICARENLTISGADIKEIITATDCDIRQVLNYLSMHSVKDKDKNNTNSETQSKVTRHKDQVLGVWDVCRMVFNEADHKTMNFADKTKLFFYDYSMGPLFVQENYLSVKPHGNNKKDLLNKVALAADSISMGDVIDSKIRSTNNWSLLESQAIFSSVMPGHYMCGQFHSKINFPLWLGKNAKANKFKRILNELNAHTRICTTATKLSMKLDHLSSLRNAILLPLLKQGLAGIDRSVDYMKSYNMLRADLDGLIELCLWGAGTKNLWTDIDTKVKAAFTRTYNKKVPLLLCAPVKKTAASVAAESTMIADDDDDDDDAGDSNDENDNIGNDAMIKLKKKKTEANRATGKKGSRASEAGTSGSKKAKTSKAKPREKKSK